MDVVCLDALRRLEVCVHLIDHLLELACAGHLVEVHVAYLEREHVPLIKDTPDRTDEERLS